MPNHVSIRVLLATTVVCALAGTVTAANYTVVDTGQDVCYGDTDAIDDPAPGELYHGQDGQYTGHPPAYELGQDGLTVHDRNSGLTWQRSPDVDGDGDIDAGDSLTWDDAVARAASLNAARFAGHDDWRLPTIKELYSLILFSGRDVSGWNDDDTSELEPFLDTDYFDFAYGDTDAGDRLIDAQYWSSTEYVSTTMGGDRTAFGVNFADGRIKGYPTEAIGPPGQQFTKRSYARYVRGNPTYGINELTDNQDGTVIDVATGLVWQQADDDIPRDWAGALDYCDTLTLATCDDWRLPDAKELQSIVDYSRSPDTTSSAAIDPVFHASAIVDEGGSTNYPCYWSGTTHLNMGQQPAAWGVYLCFGEALGWMQPPQGGGYVLMDVHGAGAQRSDPKSGDPGDWPNGNGPQGDVVRIDNHVRCVRGEPIPACDIRLEGRSATRIDFHPTCPVPAFDTVSGLLSELRQDGGYARAACLGASFGSAEDGRPNPAPGEGYYYLSRGGDACASREWGAAHGPEPDPRAALESGPCS